MLRSTALILSLAALPALAEVPQVITDIAPVQSLVARVMDGVGVPDVLLPPGASPHDYSLRPSDAQRLAGADLVIWVGHGLTPWLEDPVQTLAPDAIHLELLETSGWTALEVRDVAAFGPAAAEEHEGEHGAEHEGEHEGEHDAEHEGEHVHTGTDPHIWLDPANAAVLMGLIAQELAAADPENAAVYAANATAATAEMADLSRKVEAVLAPVAGGQYIVPHDAYQYFEAAFDMPAAGTISLTDASTPGPAHIAALQEQISAGNVTCILTDPQTSAEWTDLLRDGSITGTAAVDPDGASQSADSLSGLYPAIMMSIATGLATCLGK